MNRTSKEQVRAFRQGSTPAETALWELLRDRQLHGLKFRRQCPVSRYVADFCCKDPRIIVELDGEVHDDPSQQRHDENRDGYLRSLGFTVLRFRNAQALEEPATILTEITRTALQLRPNLQHQLRSKTPPLPGRAGGVAGEGAGGRGPGGRRLSLGGSV